MRTILPFISAVALMGTLLPSILLLVGHLNLDQMKASMLWATIVWFLATPFWMGRPSDIPDEQVLL